MPLRPPESAEPVVVPPANGAPDPRLAPILRAHWGFDSLRPLQAESIAATLAQRDSLTVLPTGGGKSLCFQVPPLITGKLTVVVSPLIALMRDQVAGLRLAGVAAGAVHSHTTDRDAANLRDSVLDGSLRLLYVAPERLITPRFIAFLKRTNIGAIAIDEAHCISQWGHDFRPEYRRLAELRAEFPGVPIGAYTATATPRVRQDILDQLHLSEDAAELVGTFDRPNLTYRVLPRIDVVNQISECLERHRTSDGHVQAAIVYCISRKETERIAGNLQARGFNAAAYHAGMSGPEREKVSGDFRDERLDIVVATVAFGMGIDRSDVRCVIHAAMPKSVEHYQQETGRAGRDGLAAECLLLYSNADYIRWKDLITSPPRNGGGGDDDAEPLSPEVVEASIALLNQMHALCSGGRCRHRALSEYFGQLYPEPTGGCGACDVCLGELKTVPDSQTIARKILSCVARCDQRFGAKHIADVLLGSRAESVTSRGHDKLSTFGLLSGTDRQILNSFINQLIDDGSLIRAGTEYPVLQLGQTARDVLADRRQIVLVEPKVAAGASRSKKRAGDAAADPLSADEQRLFDALRALRRAAADEKSVPHFMIFSDAVLAEMARVRPGSVSAFVNIRGVGPRKADEFGERFVARIRDFCAERGLTLDAREGSRPRSYSSDSSPSSPPTLSSGALAALPYFRRGATIDDICAALNRKPGTVWGYLADFIHTERPPSIAPWVPEQTQERILEAQSRLQTRFLRPIFDDLAATGEQVPFEHIRITLAYHNPAYQSPATP